MDSSIQQPVLSLNEEVSAAVSQCPDSSDELRISSDTPKETYLPTNLWTIAELTQYLKKYSTTSTVFAEQSIANPDLNKALYCIACILQAKLFDYETGAIQSNPDIPTLRIDTNLPTNLGGIMNEIPDELLSRETSNDFELREQILTGRVPTVDTILRFISWLHQSAAYSSECNIVAFIYIKRMNDLGVPLSMENWRGLWVGSVVLAQKVWDDIPLRTSAFTAILPGVSKTQLRDLESTVFRLLDYRTGVKPSVYAQYYFELREIFNMLGGEEGKRASAASRRPLTILSAKILDGYSSIELVPQLHGSRRDFHSSSNNDIKNSSSHRRHNSQRHHQRSNSSASSSKSSNSSHTKDNNNPSSTSLRRSTSSCLPSLQSEAGNSAAAAVSTTATRRETGTGKDNATITYSDSNNTNSRSSSTDRSTNESSLPSNNSSTSPQPTSTGQQIKLPAAMTLEDFTFRSKPSFYVMS